MKNKKTLKELVTKHKNKIIIGSAVTGVVVVAVVDRKLYSINVTKIAQVAKESLQRELERIDFEIEELLDSISRLDADSNINKYSRIPERLKRVDELKLNRSNVVLNLKKVKDITG